MFSTTGCTVVLPDGQELRRQRVVVNEDNLFQSFDRRTSKLRYETVLTFFDQQSKNRWVAQTDAGEIKISKSGCGCGR